MTVLVGVYTSPNGEWTWTAKVSVGASAVCFCYMLVGLELYKFWLLRDVQQQS